MTHFSANEKRVLLMGPSTYNYNQQLLFSNRENDCVSVFKNLITDLPLPLETGNEESKIIQTYNESHIVSLLVAPSQLRPWFLLYLINVMQNAEIPDRGAQSKTSGSLT